MKYKLKEVKIIFIKLLIIIVYLILSIISICNHNIENLKDLMIEILVYFCLLLGICIFLFGSFFER